jgi:predicted transcriptional regulator
MKERHDIGKLRAEEGAENRKAIFNFLRENPGSKQVDCAKHFGMNVMTINKHVKAIRLGWRPEEVQ